MKTTLLDEKDKLTIDNEGYDAPGFVSICVNDTCMDVHISNLYPAVLAFQEHYMNDLKRNKYLTDSNR